MIDEIRLKLMKNKPTFDDIASPNMSDNAKVAFRVAIRRSCKEQRKLLKQAAKLSNKK